MRARLLERQLALAGVALLATLGSLALSRAGEPDTARGPDDVPPAGAWYSATVGTYGEGVFGRITSCGVTLTRETRGVAHPELPCGARIVVAFGSREAEARVVDKGPRRRGHDFDLTRALARELGLRGADVVRWRFAEKRG